MKLLRHSPKRGRVEIIPMIDTILILLIFYMSFSTFRAREKRVDAKLPVLTAPTQVPLNLVLHVRSKDDILVNGAPYDSVSLRDAMQQLAALGQDAAVVIEAEPETDYQAVIGALDACALAKLQKVAFRPLQ